MLRKQRKVKTPRVLTAKAKSEFKRERAEYIFTALDIWGRGLYLEHVAMLKSGSGLIPPPAAPTK